MKTITEKTLVQAGAAAYAAVGSANAAFVALAHDLAHFCDADISRVLKAIRATPEAQALKPSTATRYASMVKRLALTIKYKPSLAAEVKDMGLQQAYDAILQADRAQDTDPGEKLEKEPAFAYPESVTSLVRDASESPELLTALIRLADNRQLASAIIAMADQAAAEKKAAAKSSRTRKAA